MNFCEKCGEKYVDGEKFCRKCGNKRPEQGNKPKKSKKRLGLLVFILLVVFVGAGIFMAKSGVFGTKSDEEKQVVENQTENTENNTDISATPSANGTGNNSENNNQEEGSDNTSTEGSIDDSTNPSDDVTGEGVDDENNSDVDIPVEVVPELAGKTVEYSVHNAELNDNNITAKISSVNDASVLAEVYSEDLKELLETKSVEVKAGAEGQSVDIELEVERPERFAYRVRLVDEAGEDLCTPYIDVTRTTAYENMMAKKTDDFDADKLIVLDSGSGENGGFFVIDDDIVILKNGENASLSAYDADNDILELSSLSADIAEGSKIVLMDGEDLVACITAASIEDAEGKVKISGWSGDSLTDYFKFFRFEINATDELVDAVATEGVSVLSTSVLNNQDEYNVIQVKKDKNKDKEKDEDKGKVEKEKTINYDTAGKLNLDGDLNITGGLKGTAKIVFKAAWDKEFLPDDTYFSMKLSMETTPVVEVDLGFGHEFDGSVDYDDDAILNSDLLTQTPWKNGIHISLSHIGYNLGDTKWKWLKKIGENFVLDSDFAIDISGEISGTVGVYLTTTISMESGCNVIKGFWGVPIAEPYFNHSVSEPTISFNAKAEADIFAGLKYEGKVKLSKYVELKLTARAGAQAHAKICAQTNPLLIEHPCLLCCDGEASPVVDLTFEGGVKTSWNIFGNDDDENVEANMLNKSLEIPFDIKASGYASLVHDPAAENSFEKFPYYFGLGENICPNELKEVSFSAIDKDDNPISITVKAVRSDGLWDSDKGSENEVITMTNNDSALFYPGTYTVTGEYEGETASATFKVPDSTSATLRFGKVDYYTYIRDVVLPEKGYADLETLSESYIVNKYFDNGDWYNNTGILSANLCDMNKDGVEDCVLFYVDLTPNTRFNEHSVFAQVYTVKNGKIVPFGDALAICPVSGTSHGTMNIGICEIDGQSYIYRQGYVYSITAAGGQQPSINDYFYGIVNDSLVFIMYDCGEKYDYQIEKKIPAGLKVQAKGSGFVGRDFSSYNYNQETLEYLGFTDIKSIEYSCPDWLHKLMMHTDHVSATIWDTTSIMPSLTVLEVETYHDTKGGGNSVVETTLRDYTELQKIISELP